MSQCEREECVAIRRGVQLHVEETMRLRELLSTLLRCTQCGMVGYFPANPFAEADKEGKQIAKENEK